MSAAGQPGRWRRRLPILVGLAIGLGWGWAAAEALAVPSTGSLERAYHTFIFAAVLGLVAVPAIMMRVAGRPVGNALFVTVLCAAISWLVAFNLGPRYVPPPDLVGSITLELSAPIVVRLSGEAVCDTGFDDDDGILSITGDDIGAVQGSRVGAYIGFQGTASLGITADELTGYHGLLTAWDPDADRSNGTASFVATSRGDGLPGLDRQLTAIGTVTWECRR